MSEIPEPAEDKNAQRLRIASGMAEKLMESKIIPVWETEKEDNETIEVKKIISVREFLEREAQEEKNTYETMEKLKAQWIPPGKPRRYSIDPMSFHGLSVSLEQLVKQDHPKFDLKLHLQYLKESVYFLTRQINEQAEEVENTRYIMGNDRLKAILGSFFHSDELNKKKNKDIDGADEVIVRMNDELSGELIAPQRNIRQWLPIYEGIERIFHILGIDMPLPLNTYVQQIRR